MRLDLKEILQKDGAIPFSCTTDLSDLQFSAISRFLSPVTASGRVTAGAGVLTLTGTVSAEALCLCDRCGREFTREFRIPLDLPWRRIPRMRRIRISIPLRTTGWIWMRSFPPPSCWVWRPSFSASRTAAVSATAAARI